MVEGRPRGRARAVVVVVVWEPRFLNASLSGLIINTEYVEKPAFPCLPKGYDIVLPRRRRRPCPRPRDGAVPARHAERRAGRRHGRVPRRRHDQQRGLPRPLHARAGAAPFRGPALAARRGQGKHTRSQSAVPVRLVLVLVAVGVVEQRFLVVAGDDAIVGAAAAGGPHRKEEAIPFRSPKVYSFRS